MPAVTVPALARIEIDRVFQPFPDSKTWKDGAKRGAIKAKDGVKYQVKETLLRQFRDGETCEVEVKTFGDKENPGREIVKKVGWDGQANTVPKQNVRQRMDPADALGAFVTVTFGNYVRAGKISLNRDAIKLALDEIEAGYRMHHKPQRADDLNDEIPEGDWAVNSENPAD